MFFKNKNSLIKNIIKDKTHSNFNKSNIKTLIILYNKNNNIEKIHKNNLNFIKNNFENLSKNFYNFSKKNINFNQDYSYLHIESTDKIYPKIRKYDYKFDQFYLDCLFDNLNNFLLEKNYNEALNKSFELLNFYESNKNKSHQLVNISLLIADIYLKKSDYGLFHKFFTKAEKFLNREIFEQEENKKLFILYLLKININKGIYNLNLGNEHEAILDFKKSMEILKNEDLLLNEKNNQELNLCYINILNFQALINKNNKLFEKYSLKILELIEFGKNKINNLNQIGLKVIISNIIEFNEIQNTQLIDDKNSNKLDYLNLIDEFIKYVDDDIYLDNIIINNLHLRAKFNFEAENYEISLKFLNELDEKIISSNIQKGDKEILMKNSLILKEKNLNKIYKNKSSDLLLINNILGNYLDLFNNIKNQNIQMNKNIINIISDPYEILFFENFYENFKEINENRIIKKFFDLHSYTQIFHINTSKKYEILNLINYYMLFFKNFTCLKEIIEKLNPIKNNIEKNNFGKNKSLKKIIEKSTNDLIFEYLQNKFDNHSIIKVICEFMSKEKLKDIKNNIKNNENLSQVNKFVKKQINLVLLENNNKKNLNNSALLDNLILKSYLFDISDKNPKDLNKYFKNIKLLINAKKINSQNKKLNRNINLSTIEMKLFNFSDRKNNLKNLKLEIKDKFLNHDFLSREEKFIKLCSVILTISNSLYKLSEENYTKLYMFLNNKENIYFKNLFVIKNNIGNKKINFYCEYSIDLIDLILLNEKEQIKSFVLSNTPEIKDLVSELKRIKILNFILKSYVNIYYSNNNLSEIKDIILKNKNLVDEINNHKEEGIYLFQHLENTIDQYLIVN